MSSATLAIDERVSRLRGSGEHVFHFGFGQSPFPVHPMIKLALAESSDKAMYLPTSGLHELRLAAVKYFAKRLGIPDDGYEALVGPGSKELIFDFQMAIEGDLLLPVPSWVSYAPQALMLGDSVVWIPTSLSDSYHLTAEGLERAIQTATRTGRQPAKLVLNYPNNPSGLTLSRSRLKEIAEVCRHYHIIVISDEIYGLVSFRRNHLSIANFYPEGTIVTTGISKHISLGGYRLGVGLVPAELRTVFDTACAIATETWSCVSAPIQFAGLKAFEGLEAIEEYIAKCTAIHRLVGEFVRGQIESLGIEYPQLEGAFYMYPDFSAFRQPLMRKGGIRTSEDLCRDLLEKELLATLPGTAFGTPPETLALRLANCDFDGERALACFDKAEKLGLSEFMNCACPNIVAGCGRLTGYFKQL